MNGFISSFYNSNPNVRNEDGFPDYTDSQSLDEEIKVELQGKQSAHAQKENI